MQEKQVALAERPRTGYHAGRLGMLPIKLVIMVKAPRPGAVKTRLARTLGDDPACRAYRELVDCLVRNLAGLSPVELRFTPDDAKSEIQSWLAPGWTAAAQGPGDLGQRLQRAVRDSIAAGPVRLVIVGSDCPWIGAEDIREAWERLADQDLVLGPARDGGYWLIGVNRPQPALFANIAWSTEAVFGQTMERARALGLRVHCLRELSDVDDAVGWGAFKTRSSS